VSSTQLPVADAPAVKRYARTLIREYPRELGLVVVLYGVTAVAGLGAPRLLGSMVEHAVNDKTVAGVDKIAIVLAVFVVGQTLMTAVARYAASVLGEKVFARLREEFVRNVLDLPLSTVERAGSGDLLTRMVRDIDALSNSVRFAVPQTLIALVTAALTLGALLLVGPLLALPCLVSVPIIYYSTRWYLRRAPAGYIRENASYSRINSSLTETIDGARTVEALGTQAERVAQTDEDIRGSWKAERFTLYLRTVWFPTVEIGYVLPVVLTLLFGGVMYSQGHASIGQVTAATLYVQQLIGPVDELISWLDELQIGAASMARLLGVAQVPADREPSGEHPTDQRIEGRDIRYAYREGHDVLKGIDLQLRPGERLAIVGPSGAGKSTLGRLLAGIHGPTHGEVTVGGVELVDLPLGELRGQVALVTQEHHVFVGTVRDNVGLARPNSTDDQVIAALRAVDAWDWVERLEKGLETKVGSGELALSPAQAQQVALARLVLADPHTLVLDEATSLIDPRAARHLERSLSAVVEGRTVVAIAHRLHTAHDADRVAVVEDGLISEIGSHDELVEADGAYAALWRSWRS
jgi:ABC-type multidrug transport system fused ATPase/permease subunit